jgi:hypothetical protein
MHTGNPLETCGKHSQNASLGGVGVDDSRPNGAQRAADPKDREQVPSRRYPTRHLHAVNVNSFARPERAQFVAWRRKGVR